MILHNMALKIASVPKKIFLLDGIGALTSSILLGLVLPSYPYLTGLPVYLLKFLASLALVFCIYSLACYLLLPKLEVKRFSEYIPNIKIITYSNIAYVMLTVGIIIYHYDSVKIFGTIYFLGEIITMMIIILLEQKVISQLRGA